MEYIPVLNIRLITIIILITPLFLAYSPLDEEPERLIIYVSDDSVIKRAKILGVSPKEIDSNITPVLLEDAQRLVDELRRNGIRLDLVDILTYSAHVIIVDIYGTNKAELESISNMRVFDDTILELDLQKSSPLIGARAAHNHLLPNGENLTGRGIVVAIVDTGIDYTHPDLGGELGPGNKVIGGYDFVDKDDDPRDIQGHGTHVAGIVAGNGGIIGISPDVELLAYRVVESSGRVRTSNVAVAIERAIRDEADIINLSLGANVEVEALRSIIVNAVDAGVIVVAAVGNSGPTPGSIGDPAGYPEIISVGAAYNDRPIELGMINLDDSNLEIVGLPLLGSPDTNGIILGEITFVKHASSQDVAEVDLRGKIALAERRGSSPNEALFFSTKESNVAKRGAVGLIVFNTEPGMVQGNLLHGGNPSEYVPTIPTMFITRQDGMKIIEELSNGRVQGDFIFERRSFSEMASIFSSRGPVSPFYIKPDLISPGDRINSTWVGGGHSVQGGTSFSAPHVTGGVALLLQMHGNLTKDQVAGILGPTSVPLENSFSIPWSADTQGSGRMDLVRALRSPIAVVSHQVSINLAEEQDSFSRAIRIDSLVNTSTSISIRTEWDFSPVEVSTNTSSLTIEGRESRFISLSAELADREVESTRLEGRLLIDVESSDPLTLTIPLIVSINPISIGVVRGDDDGFEISMTSSSSHEIAFVRISGPNLLDVYDEEVPFGEIVRFAPEEPGEYWVQIAAVDGEKVIYGSVVFFNDITGKTPSEEEEIIKDEDEIIRNIPVRFLQILLVSITVIAMGASIYLLTTLGKRNID